MSSDTAVPSSWGASPCLPQAYAPARSDIPHLADPYVLLEPFPPKGLLEEAHAVPQFSRHVLRVMSANAPFLTFYESPQHSSEHTASPCYVHVSFLLGHRLSGGRELTSLAHLRILNTEVWSSYVTVTRVITVIALGDGCSVNLTAAPSRAIYF